MADPEIDIVLRDDGPSPETRVAPAGLLQVRVVNHGSRTHRLVLLRDGDPARATPVETLPAVEPGGEVSAEWELESGEYLLVGDASPGYAGPRVLELTIQPGERGGEKLPLSG